jgi:hypothetical protein
LKAFILLLLLPNPCLAQMISNELDCFDEAAIVFSPEFIKQNKIKSIQGRISIKKPLQTIRTTNLFTQYFFDENGRVTSSFEQNDFGKEVWRKYVYNDNGYLIYQSVGNQWDFKYTTYLFDDSIRVVAKDEFARKEDNMGIPNTKEVNNESYSYGFNDSSSIKTIKNHAGTPYMKHVCFFNKKGKVSRQENRYIATNEGSVCYFEYNSQGRVTLCNKVSSKQGMDIQKDQFAYDELGNLKEIKHFEKGVMVLETQFIVNQKTGLLSAILEQEGSSNILKITRFQTYEYYD